MWDYFIFGLLGCFFLSVTSEVPYALLIDSVLAYGGSILSTARTSSGSTGQSMSSCGTSHPSSHPHYQSPDSYTQFTSPARSTPGHTNNSDSLFPRQNSFMKIQASPEEIFASLPPPGLGWRPCLLQMSIFLISSSSPLLSLWPLLWPWDPLTSVARVL